MSYFFQNQCHNCADRDECTDRHVIEGAISAIHATPHTAHLGSGEIELNCCNHKPQETTDND